MATLRIYASESAEVRQLYPQQNFSGDTATHYDYDAVTGQVYESWLYCKFAIPDTLNNKVIKSVTVGAYIGGNGMGSSTSERMYFYAAGAGTQTNLVTWDTRTYMDGYLNYATLYASTSGYVSAYIHTHPIEVLQNGVYISAPKCWLYTSGGENPPYLNIEYEEPELTPVITQIDGIDISRWEVASAYISTANEHTVIWDTSASAMWNPSITVSSAKLKLNKGDGTGYSTIAEGAGTEYTIAAGTLPTGNFHICVEATYSNGVTATSNLYLLRSAAPEASGLTPGAGYVPRGQSNTFSWRFLQKELRITDNAPDYDAMLDIDQLSGVLKWKTSDGDTTSIILGTAKSLTVTANTFPAKSTIEWMVELTTYGELTATSNWVTVTTEDVTSTARAVSPRSTTVDGAQPIKFEWEHIINTGTAQTAADIQTSTDGSTWTDLASVTGADTYYTAAANAFAAGSKYWRVRTYNADSVAGAWSDAAQFVVVAAPTTPVISIQSLSPRPEITWQTNEQDAYQVRLGSLYDSKIQFGAEKRWKCPIYLEDGDYTVSVRVQNSFGLWSDWGVGALPITNTPGSAITLAATAGRETALVWESDGYDYYIVYRDETAIAKTQGSSYIDRLAIGEVTYRVRGCYDDSANYGLSNAVAITVTCETIMLLDIAANKWLTLRLSEEQHRQTIVTTAQNIYLVQMAGQTYPTAEHSIHRSKTVDVSCAFANNAESRELENMLGKLVCVKTPRGNAVVGYLSELTKNSNSFYDAFTFTVTQINNAEEIDIDA